MRRRLTLVAGLAVGVIAAALGTAGCVSFDHLEVCEVTNTEGATVSETQIRLRKGTAVALKGIPFDTDHSVMDDDTRVFMESGDEAVLGLAPLDYDGDECGEPEDAHWYYLLWGQEVGTTTLTVYGAGELALEIPVQVTE